MLLPWQLEERPGSPDGVRLILELLSIKPRQKTRSEKGFDADRWCRDRVRASGAAGNIMRGWLISERIGQ